jgi:hypothetical protein
LILGFKTFENSLKTLAALKIIAPYLKALSSWLEKLTLLIKSSLLFKW